MCNQVRSSRKAGRVLLCFIAVLGGALLAAGPVWGQAPPLLSGTLLRVKFDTTAGSQKSRAGDAVQAHLIEPAMAGNTEVLPIDTILSGEVRDARQANEKWGMHPMLRLEFHKVTLPDGRTFQFRASAANLGMALKTDSEGVITPKKILLGPLSSITKKDLVLVATAAGIGAAIGAASIPPSIAGPGAGVGAMAAAGVALLVILEVHELSGKGKNFELKKGRKAWLRMDHDLEMMETTPINLGRKSALQP